MWPQGQKPLPEGQVPRRKAFRARHNLGVHLNVCHLERKKCPSFGAAFSLYEAWAIVGEEEASCKWYSAFTIIKKLKLVIHFLIYNSKEK